MESCWETTVWLIFSERSLGLYAIAHPSSILSHNFIAQQSCSMQLCISHTATFSHKQKLTNQRSPHSRHKVAQNTALLYSEKELHDCSRVARHAMSHLRFCRVIKLLYKVARQNCKCDIGPSGCVDSAVSVSM